MRRILSCLTLIIVLIVGGWLYVHLQFEKPHDNPFGAKEFVVAEGENAEVIANHLQTQGFISSPLYFKTYITLKQLESKLHAGTFVLDTRMSVKELAGLLIQKNAGRQEVKITMVEGWALTDIAEYLAKKLSFTEQDFLDLAKQPKKFDYDFLKEIPADGTLEGYLFPDTFMVYDDITPEELINKMLANFNRKVSADLRAEIKSQKKTLFEIITLASIVEKEMHGLENRQIVAGIFWNRLEGGMRLQSDATVNYITRAGTTRPSIKDTEIENPYNTYRNDGLPIGPISNPGIESINAVVYPKETNYYFFLTTPDNEIIYSRNLEEHIVNRNKHLE